MTYTSTSEPSPKTIITTDLRAELVVAEGVYNVTLVANNSVGQSPMRHVRINTGLIESESILYTSCTYFRLHFVQGKRTSDNIFTVTEA